MEKIQNNLKLSSQDVNQNQAKTFFIRLINSTDIDVCPFWIGLFNKGELSLGDVFKNFDVKNILEYQSLQGFVEEEPLMFSDTMSLQAKFIYLLPKSNTANAQGIIDKIISVLKNWSSVKLGLYFNPQIIELNEGIKLTHNLLVEVIKNSLALEIFLYTGNYGINKLLNITTQLKEKFLNNPYKIYIFH